MDWRRANETQTALAQAEEYFVSVCDTEDEVDEDELAAAEAEMQRACAEADDALNAIRLDTDDWASAIAVVLR